MLNRRDFLGALAGGAAGAAAANRPNIVIILADDLGYGDLACYGHPTIKTPNLDRMAAQGMKFTQFYSAAPFCSPSRAALLTGRLPIRSGINYVLFPYSKGGIQDSEITLAEMLRGQGYATACVGKWHLGHLPRYLPTKHGFDSYFGIPYSNDMSPKTSRNPKKDEWPPTPLIRNDDVVEQEPDQNLITKRYTDDGIKFIRDSVNKKKPFYLHFCHTMPHWPLAASGDYRGKSKRGLYGDAVEELDWSVGEMLKTLRESGVERNTLVFFTSDNGAAVYLKEEGGSEGLFREGKGTTWEGGIREPGIAYWPGRVPAGVTTQAFATTMDLFPTCVNLGGAKVPTDREYDGVDLAPILFENKPGREPLYFYYNGTPLRAVRKGPWKLHIAVTNVATADGLAYKEVNPPWLFNVEEDPSERFEVAAKQPEIVKELLDLIAKHKATLKPGPPQT